MAGTWQSLSSGKLCGYDRSSSNLPSDSRLVKLKRVREMKEGEIGRSVHWGLVAHFSFTMASSPAHKVFGHALELVRGKVKLGVLLAQVLAEANAQRRDPLVDVQDLFERKESKVRVLAAAQYKDLSVQL